MIDQIGARQLVGDIFHVPATSIRPDVVEELEAEVGSLPHDERLVLEVRYGLRGERSQALRQIAPLIEAMTQERFRRILARALKRLRHPYHSKVLRQYILTHPILPGAGRGKKLTTKKDVELEAERDKEWETRMNEYAQSLSKRLEELSKKPLLQTYFVEVLEKLDKILEELQLINKHPSNRKKRGKRTGV